MGDQDRRSAVWGLTFALVLALIAPREEQSRRAVALADELAAGLTAAEIKAAKSAAREHCEMVLGEGGETPR